MLVPGLGNNARLWAGQVTALSAEFEVIVAGYSGAKTIGEMAEAVLAQIPATTFALAGFSLGSYIALRLVSQHAERVSCFALISSSPFADAEPAIQQRRKLIEKAGQDYPKLLRDMSQFIVFADGPRAENARQELISMGLEMGAEEFCRQQRAAMQRPDMRDTLGSIHCPTRVLCGQEDKVTPVSGNRCLAESIPGARLEIIKAAGHLLPLERPAEVSHFLLEFLRETRY